MTASGVSAINQDTSLLEIFGSGDTLIAIADLTASSNAESELRVHGVRFEVGATSAVPAVFFGQLTLNNSDFVVLNSEIEIARTLTVMGSRPINIRPCAYVPNNQALTVLLNCSSGFVSCTDAAFGSSLFACLLPVSCLSLLRVFCSYQIVRCEKRKFDARSAQSGSDDPPRSYIG